MNIRITRILIVAISYVLTYFLAVYFGYIYALFTPASLGGSFIPTDAAHWIVGLPLGLIALVTFSLRGLGGKNIWLWTTISLAPAILFEILLDPFHIYIPIIVGLVAWGLGILAHKTLQKIAPSIVRGTE